MATSWPSTIAAGAFSSPSVRTTEGYAPVTSLRLRENSRTRGPSLTASVRYPSHFTSYDQSSPTGSADAGVAIIGEGTGGGIVVMRTFRSAFAKLETSTETRKCETQYALRMSVLEFRSNVRAAYPDVLTPEAIATLEALAPLDAIRQQVMRERIARRNERARHRQPIAFLDPGRTIPRTSITVQDARDGRFEGSDIPADLKRQWIQGTGPAARPDAPTPASIRNVAYALLSGADGWMFDGEDALGQISTMSRENQRNLKLAIHRDSVFLAAAEQVAREMNAWAQDFFGDRLPQPMIRDWQRQLDFTTTIFRARGLHLDDRQVRHADGRGFSASIADAVLYVVNNQTRLRARGSSLV